MEGGDPRTGHSTLVSWGDVIVLKMGEKYEVLATNSHPGQIFISSPVIVDNEIYLRGSTALYAASNQSSK